MANIDFKKLTQKWNKEWAKSKIYQPDLSSAKKPFYNLYMFPYPSAEGLHVGHAFSGTGADVYARFKRMQGDDVFQPMGFDAFGIHSENFALKIGDHPQNLINRATKHFREQFDSLGFSYDWSHSVNTSESNYYKWTQWIFTTFFKAGLVVKKKASVNWCPSCKTVLADEQVLQKSKVKSQKSKLLETAMAKVCERCGTEVETRELEQWFFRITQYADKLLEGLSRIDWTEKVKIAQKNWIGRSEGARIKFKISNSKYQIEVFTTRPDTLYGATFMVISPFHPLLQKAKLTKEAKNYIAEAKRKLTYENEKEKTGVFSGLYAINPVNKEEIPVWIADYVLMAYGTGAIMAVPAHDQRDFEFAKKYNLPIKEVVEGGDVEKEAYLGSGKLINSEGWNNIKVPQDISSTINDLEEKGFGKREVNYHLRDWLISRQRYWGAPIPMIFCEVCEKRGESWFTSSEGKKTIENSAHDWAAGWYPVPDSELPVELPYIENFKPLGTGKSPLAQDESFVSVKCPNCGSKARRETDVADTFLDSSWYFLRYPSTEFDTVAFDEKITKKWLPVHMYIGGAEHSVLHLLYSRFVTKVLFDLKLINFDEPFTKFRAHGLIIKEGSKMSKSRGNVVNPDEYIEKYGPDAIRLYLMFLGPFDAGGDFRDSGMEGMGRFVKKIVRFVNYQTTGDGATFLSFDSAQDSSREFIPRDKPNKKLDQIMHKTIREVSRDLENLSYNTAIARIMEYLNALTKEADTRLDPKYVKTLILLLAPFAPYIAEEAYQNFEKGSVHTARWPEFDSRQAQEETVAMAIQINGKLRDVLSMDLISSQEESTVSEVAMKSPKIKAHLVSKKVIKTIFIKGKVLNIVTD